MTIIQRALWGLALASGSLIGTSVGQAQSIRYVDDDGVPGGDGLSWDTAYDDLQDALDYAALSGGTVSEIRVAGGTYRPDRGAGDRGATFQLINGVAVYGSFHKTESTPDERDLSDPANRSILSGDLNEDDGDEFANTNDNSYHVVTGSGTDETALLDGFAITGGNANGTDTESRGGGMYNVAGSPTVTGCIFRWNSAHTGAAVHNNASSPTLRNCSFLDNATTGGAAGAVYNISASSPVFVNCTFVGNSGFTGGGIYHNGAGNVTLTNCVFSGNAASTGGALYNFGGDLTLTNCIFSGNSASFGAGMYAVGGTLTLTNSAFSRNTGNTGGGIFVVETDPSMTNCIFWGNTDDDGTGESAQIRWDALSTVTVNYSCIQGLTGALGGTGNIGENPRFADADGKDDTVGTEDDDLRLLPGSPCIDAGDTQAVPPDTCDLDRDDDLTEPTPWDVQGNPRILDDPETPDSGVPLTGTPEAGVVDMGAHEFAAETPACLCGDIDRSGRIDLSDFVGFVACFGLIAPTSQCGPDQWACSDIDGDGEVSLTDFVTFASVFGLVVNDLSPDCGS